MLLAFHARSVQASKYVLTGAVSFTSIGMPIIFALDGETFPNGKKLRRRGRTSSIRGRVRNNPPPSTLHNRETRDPCSPSFFTLIIALPRSRARTHASFFHRIVIISLIAFFFSPFDSSFRYPGILIAFEPRAPRQIYDANWYRVFSSYIGGCRIGCSEVYRFNCNDPGDKRTRNDSTRFPQSACVDLSLILFFFLFFLLLSIVHTVHFP